MATNHTDLVTCSAGLTVSGTLTLPTSSTDFANDIPRDAIAQKTLAKVLLPLHLWKKHNDPAASLPATSSGSDLGLYGTTYGTNTPEIMTYDVKAAGAQSLYARFPSLMIPYDYDDGETIQIVSFAGMEGAVADTSCTIDFEAYKVDGQGGVTGSDLITTVAQSINSLTFADKTFTLDASNVDPGDILDIRMTVAVNDAASASSVQAAIGKVYLQLDIR